MRELKLLLWDIDGTLLNFREAEKVGVRMGFARFGMGECTDGMIARYSAINRSYWERLERGEMTKPEVLVGRFREFFSLYGLPVDRVEEFNRNYQHDLGETIVFCDDAPEVIRALHPFVRQYGVTNGTRCAQERKLVKSGLDRLLDGVFISEDVGAEKPAVEFFDAVQRSVGAFVPGEVMIIGDSLTSDMRGGNNAGILTCWYRQEGTRNDRGVRLDYEISDLHEVVRIVESRRTV